MAMSICVTCGTQFAEREGPPDECPICPDPRQYVGLSGQEWTTLEALRTDHTNTIRAQGDLVGIGTEPKFAIGQRALLVPYGDSNLLWDCITLLDDATAAEVERRGGIAAIAISHPHYYSCMVEWARRFDCPIHLHAADAEWIMRPDDAIDPGAGGPGGAASSRGTARPRTSATASPSSAAAGTSRAGRSCTARTAPARCSPATSSRSPPTAPTSPPCGAPPASSRCPGPRCNGLRRRSSRSPTRRSTVRGGAPSSPRTARRS